MKIELGGLPTILTIVFVVLKLTHVITWSWWWVFSPLWIAVGIFLAVLAFILVITIIAAVVKGLLS